MPRAQRIDLRERIRLRGYATLLRKLVSLLGSHDELRLREIGSVFVEQLDVALHRSVVVVFEHQPVLVP